MSENQVNMKWEDAFQLPWLEHAHAYHAVLENLHQGSVWNVEIFTRGRDSKMLLKTRVGSISRIELCRLGEMKRRWSGRGYADIQAKLNALQNVQDDDLMWFPESIRHGELEDVPFTANTNYAIRFTDDAHDVCRLNFNQKERLPKHVTIQTAGAGQHRWLYCYYQL